jgi:hypothetical protein
MGEGRREQGEKITTFVLKYQIRNLNYEQLIGCKILVYATNSGKMG